MNHIQNLSLCQDTTKNYDGISHLINYAKLDSISNLLPEEIMHKQEAISVTKAKKALGQKIISPAEALQILSNFEAYKESKEIFEQRQKDTALSENIKTIPIFSQPKVQSVELSGETNQTFGRISARARKVFIEEQIRRAEQYNIPYNAYTTNFLELSYKIDQHEMLLERAKEYGIYWDISEYDPVALKQEIEENENSSSLERNDLYAYFVSTRGLEV